jgi:hypothetical protein
MEETPHDSCFLGIGLSDELVGAAEVAARAAHEANRIICKVAGEDLHDPWAIAGKWQRDSSDACVLAILRNPKMTPEECHRRWTRDRLDGGWKYGPIKDVGLKIHPCLVPYDELPVHQKAKDEMFALVVRAVLGIGEFGRGGDS